MIVGVDVGGTKVHLAAFSREGESLTKGVERIIRTDSVPSLNVGIADFVAEESLSLEALGLGVAGPVAGDVVTGSNLPWRIDAASLRRDFSCPVGMVNDLVASAIGLDEVSPDDLVTLQEGERSAQHCRALVSPGTGLGETVMIEVDGRWHAVPSEGGHADFAPRHDDEIALLQYLRPHFGRVSIERVVSGPGLVNCYCFCRDRAGEAGEIPAQPGMSGAAAPIAKAALDGSSRLCREALDLWVSAFGAIAGNAALRGVTLGGVWLGGGIPARVLPALQTGTFLEAFLDKEPHRDLLKRVPVQVVLDAETTLKGAARVGARA